MKKSLIFNFIKTNALTVNINIDIDIDINIEKSIIFGPANFNAFIVRIARVLNGMTKM
jgi:hypothetical protein